MNIIEQTTAQLEHVPQALRDEIIAAEKTEAVHRHYMQLPCMQQIEQGDESNTAGTQVLADHFRVIAWNMERCIDVKNSAALLAHYQPDIVLLSEMDNGMARSAQRHTTQALANALGMHYLYAVEFLELDLGNDIEQALATDDFNKQGFHGNGILSKVPFEKVAMLRFDSHGHWFAGQQVGDSFGEPRVGGRNAILANLPCSQGTITVVSTHLESNADVVYRGKQFKDLTQVAAAFAAEAPIIIGGDLNTGNNLADGLDHTAETLFAAAEANGFHWQANATGDTTRASRISKRKDRLAKLDWFAAKGINSTHTEIVPALDANANPLSDHEFILADWSLT